MKITLSQAYSFYQLGQRGNQEDARYPDVDMPVDALPFFVVCDGVGGSEKGEVASRTVCAAFGGALSKADWDKTFTISDFKTALDYAYDALELVVEEAGTTNMATTLTLVAFHRGGVLAAHIGDSRIYHIRPSVGILYRSNDHSLVNALVKSGNLSPDDADNHPQSNVIMRSMSYVSSERERSSATALNIRDVAAGDYFVLCTDGVLHNITDDRLVEILGGDETDEEKRNKIAELCRDSSDNNTAYIIPVKSVELDEGEEIENAFIQEDLEEYDDEHESSKDTIRINVKPEVAQEVSSSRSKSLKDKVMGFFKKYF